MRTESKNKVIIKEEDWKNSIYSTKEWEHSVVVKRWEHDYVKKEYIIDYEIK